MIQQEQLSIGAPVWFYDNSAKIVNTTCESEVMNHNGEPSCHVLAQKEPIAIKYLYAGHAASHINVGSNIVKKSMVGILKVPETPVVVYKATILDTAEEVILTPELITKKSQDLLALKILGIGDDAGYAAVKKAVQKAVKMRTTIERLEKDEKAKDKKVLDAKAEYTKLLYAACREVQTSLQKKLDDIDTQKAAELKKQQDAQAELIEKREKAMYDNGMLFNNVAFVGHGKQISKDYLMSLPEESFDSLVAELEEMQDLAENFPPLTFGDLSYAADPIKSAPQVGIPMYNSIPTASNDAPNKEDTSLKGIFEQFIPETNGIKIVITKGMVKERPGQLVLNQRVINSAYYVQVVVE